MNRAIVIAALLVALATPAAAGPRYEIFSTRKCLAGGWEPGTPEAHGASGWRVQLGVFADEHHANRLVERLGREGLDAETYVAWWLDRRDLDGPEVVVSPAYPTRAAALRAARRYRRLGLPVLVRRFVLWT